MQLSSLQLPLLIASAMVMGFFIGLPGQQPLLVFLSGFITGFAAVGVYLSIKQ